MTNRAYEISGPSRIPAASAERILRALPQWFGIESALLDYASDAASLVNFLAADDERLIGFVTLREHNAVSLELNCIAVLPAWHREGVGRHLCAAAQAWWAERGGKLIQVKTLGPSRPNEYYARTRAFYGALGFVPVEEFSDLWPGNPCLLLVKPLWVQRARSAARSSSSLA